MSALLTQATSVLRAFFSSKEIAYAGKPTWDTNVPNPQVAVLIKQSVHT